MWRSAPCVPQRSWESRRFRWKSRSTSEQGCPPSRSSGFPTLSLQEARERVRSAVRASGFELPNARVVVNLAPGPLRKHGTGFDLPIALGLLVATGQLPRTLAERFAAVGELALDGSVRAVPGMLAYALGARSLGLPLLGPAESVHAASQVRGRLSAAGTSAPPAAIDSVGEPEARASVPRCERCRARLRRCGRPRACEAGASYRGRRWPQRPHDRPARLRQDHARALPAEHSAATGCPGTARDRAGALSGGH